MLPFLLLPAISSCPEAMRRAACLNNLKAISLAMQTYHADHGSFPPAYIADEHGRPMHSWRVLLLPYLDGEALYKQYHFDEPWNSPHNLALADQIPKYGALPVYCCPSSCDADYLHTSYVMLVGPEAISDGPNAHSIDDFTDGTSNTIAVVEMSESGIHWMQPQDMNVEEMSFKINDDSAVGIRSKHPVIANVLFAGGSVKSIHHDIAPEVLKGLTTIAGGEDVDVYDYDY